MISGESCGGWAAAGQRKCQSSGESCGDGQVRGNARALVKAVGIGSSRSEEVLELW